MVLGIVNFFSDFKNLKTSIAPLTTLFILYKILFLRRRLLKPQWYFTFSHCSRKRYNEKKGQNLAALSKHSLHFTISRLSSWLMWNPSRSETQRFILSNSMWTFICISVDTDMKFRTALQFHYKLLLKNITNC